MVQGDVNEKIPFLKLVILGIQHVLVMYAGAIAVPLIIGAAIGLTKEQVAFLIKADLFTCGIATILQSLGIGGKIGIKLPVIMGVTFVAVTPMINIGQHLGLQYIYGAIIISGILVFIIAPYFSKIAALFPPIITGTILTVIGINLISVAMNWAAGGASAKDYGSNFNLLLAFGVMLLILLLIKYTSGFLKSTAVLLGMAAGCIFAYIAGRMNISGMSAEPWVSVTLPFWFGMPKFDIAAVITMTLVAVICMVESTGVFFAVEKIVGREVKEKDLASGFRAEGIAIFLGSIFNSFPYTTFSQNVGLLAITKVKSRFVTVMAGFILVMFGLFPKLAFIVASMPAPVLGGAGIIMFGMVSATGLSMLSTVDYCRTENLMIIAVSIGIGVGISLKPDIFNKLPPVLEVLLSDGILMTCISAVLLNFFFKCKDKD